MQNNEMTEEEMIEREEKFREIREQEEDVIIDFSTDLSFSMASSSTKEYK